MTNITTRIKIVGEVLKSSPDWKDLLESREELRQYLIVLHSSTLNDSDRKLLDDKYKDFLYYDTETSFLSCSWNRKPLVLRNFMDQFKEFGVNQIEDLYENLCFSDDELSLLNESYFWRFSLDGLLPMLFNTYNDDDYKSFKEEFPEKEYELRSKIAGLIQKRNKLVWKINVLLKVLTRSDISLDDIKKYYPKLYELYKK